MENKKSVLKITSSVLAAAALMLFSLSAQSQQITRDNFAFIAYPGFPEQSSTWDDIGYDATNNVVYIGVTNHKDNQGWYAYDVAKQKMELLGFIRDMTGLREQQWQGKVHTKIVEGPDGNMYFGTDGGESRQEYLMNHPHGYHGGFFMKWDPATGTMRILSKVPADLRYESIKDVCVDKETGIVYGISYPQVHFIKYDPSTNEMRDLGRLGSAHVPRVMFTDKWGNVYYMDWRQRLVKYDKGEDRFFFAKTGIPRFPDQPGQTTVTGITAYAKDEVNNVIYFAVYNGMIAAIHPQKTGMGKIDTLGRLVPEKYYDSGIPPWHAYTPDMAVGKNGKVYYFSGSEGRYVQKGKCLFMEYDPETGKKQLIYDFPTSEVAIVSGSNTTDKEGNMYFAAFKNVKVNGHSKSVPFMIKFNPLHKVQR